jgi:hypothetical protein
MLEQLQQVFAFTFPVVSAEHGVRAQVRLLSMAAVLDLCSQLNMLMPAARAPGSAQAAVERRALMRIISKSNID